MISLTLVLILVPNVFSARILGIVSLPSYSHHYFFRPLWTELSLRGHQVTVLTTHPMKNAALTNLTEIDLSHAAVEWENMNINEDHTDGPFMRFSPLLQLYHDVIESELQHPDVQALINNSTEHFDVLLAEGLLPVMFYFAERFKCPFINIISLEAKAITYRQMGNPTSPALYPDFMLPYPAGTLDFWQRAESFAYEICSDVFDRWVRAPYQEQQGRKYFGQNYPGILEIESKAAMIFTNTDNVLHPVRPLLPNVVMIGGGTHVKTAQPLPSQLQKKLDAASEHGFIYFSLGTNIKSKNLRPETRKQILEAFADLPQLVLWKFELDDMPGKPSNVILSKWFPQQDILRHPNIKVFITQGGLQSIDEGLHAQVPMIGIPYLADQPKNVRNMVHKGLGLMVEGKTLNKESLKSAILEVVNNPKYKETAVRLAQLAKDQPMTGLERAIWWTEYVIRNKGADHLRSPALDLPWYQYFLLDVIAFSLTVALILTVCLWKLIKLTVRVIKKALTIGKKVKTH